MRTDESVHMGTGSDLMSLCRKVTGTAGKDQVRFSYVISQVTCLECLKEYLDRSAVVLNQLIEEFDKRRVS